MFILKVRLHLINMLGNMIKSCFLILLLCIVLQQCSGISLGENWEKMKTKFWTPKESVACYRQYFLQLFDTLDQMYPHCNKRDEINTFKRTVKGKTRFIMNILNEGETQKSFQDTMKNAEKLGNEILAGFKSCIGTQCAASIKEKTSKMISLFEENIAKCGTTKYLEDGVSDIQKTITCKSQPGDGTAISPFLFHKSQIASPFSHLF